MPPPLVLAVHGSTVPAATATLERLCAQVRHLCGVRPVVGHLSHQEPSLPQALDAAGPGAMLVPLLLGDGYHRTVDIPALVGDRDCVLAPGLGGDEEIAHALHERLREAERAAGGRADAVVLASAGSTHPGGNDGALAAARDLRAQLDECRGPVPVLTAYCAKSPPSVHAAVRRLYGHGCQRVAVVTHLLAPGRFTRVLPHTRAWVVTAPLADHPRLARLVASRYAEAAPVPAGRRTPAADEDVGPVRR
ncbi:sirohydrochlorin chelatase [Streptomyces huasconensis]|uniref:CbiX/SirB N-terminal domain-containing protein n=1 Tax=Streptomyces huasconensis TaxID=1854574 RepID=A0ABV3M355_9ACTN